MSLTKSLATRFLALAALVWPSLAFSQVAPPSHATALSIEDALKLRSLAPYSAPSISPDGTLLAYTVIQSQETRHFETEAWARTGVPWYGVGAQIFVLNLQTGLTSDLTGGVGNNWRPTWSPDGNTLAFLSDRDGSGQAGLWLWDPAKHTLRKVSNAKIRADQIEWSPDSAKIIVGAMPDGLSVEAYVTQMEFPGGQNGTVGSVGPGSTVSVYEAASARSAHSGRPVSDPWNLNQMLHDLTLIDIRSGRADLLVHGLRIAAYRLSPDGAMLAFTIAKHFEKPGSQQIIFDLAVFALATGKEQVVVSDARFDYNGEAFSWSPDAFHLGFCTEGSENGGLDCRAVTLADSHLPDLSPASQPGTCGGHRITRPLWNERGDEIYFVCDGALWRSTVHQSMLQQPEQVARITNRHITQIISNRSNLLWTINEGDTTIVMTHDGEEKRDGLYQVDLVSGRSARLIEADECYSCVPQSEQVIVDFNGNNAVYSAEDAQHAANLWLLSSTTLSNPRRLTDLNPQFHKYKMGKARLVRWLSDDGELLQGALLLPADYREGNRYPLLTYVYGGSSLSNNVNRFGLAFVGPFNMQLFATRGYAVLLPDSPQHLGTPLLDLAKTVLPGINKVIEMGIADGQRLGVLGHSNGGYGTLGLIVLTTRFKAAMTADGTGDLLSLYSEMSRDGTAYGTANLENGQNALGGTPWEVRDKFVENSPFFYLDRVKTPLLIVHGAEDRAVASFLAEQIFVGLRRLDREVQYARYEGEGHSPSYWSYGNQVDFCQRMIEWFDGHLRGEDER
jgi:dipeptidyl aminopeptidase/acylaminoacyl peptidase